MFVMGTPTNRLSETVRLRTQNKCLKCCFSKYSQFSPKVCSWKDTGRLISVTSRETQYIDATVNMLTSIYKRAIIIFSFH